MSRGPGRIQRAIITLITTPEATTTLVDDDASPGPVGVPLTAIYFELWDTTNPTRAQKESVRRAVVTLCRNGTAETYSRRECPRDLKYAPFNWDEQRRKYGCCGWIHIPKAFVGRPRTETEQATSKQQFARAMAMVKQFR